MFLRVAACFLGLSVFHLAAVGQEPASKVARTVYLVKQGPAKDLAAALTMHFKGEIEVAVVPASNALMLSGRAPTLQEIEILLAKLDRAPRMIAIDVWIAEKASDGAPPPPAEKGAESSELDFRELSGAADVVRTRLEGLQRKGLIARVKQIQLFAMENEKSSAMMGEVRPTVAGVSGRAGGPGGGFPANPPSVQVHFRNVGTMVNVVPRITPDNRITLDLTVEDSRLHTPANGIPLGANDRGTPVNAAETLTGQVTGKLSVASGQAVLAQGMQTTGRTAGNFLVIVSARVVEDSRKEPR